MEPEGVYSFEMRDRMEHSPKALLRVEQFGTVEWIGLSFSGCKNMQFAEGIDTPDLSKVTNMANMFSGCASFNQPLNSWDVSKVTAMWSMFSGCASFNQPLNSWDVSKV
ncbi:MAG: BspA family leucine-rich repeat surface protein, partial [Bacteroides sp.]